MTNHCDRRRLRSLVLSAIDNLNEVARARELTNIIEENQIVLIKNERSWDKVEILLESYEKRRDEYLEPALADLEQIRQIITRPIEP